MTELSSGASRRKRNLGLVQLVPRGFLSSRARSDRDRERERKGLDYPDTEIAPVAEPPPLDVTVTCAGFGCAMFWTVTS